MAQLKLVDASPDLDLDSLNARFADASPETLLLWARDTFGDKMILTSSFGADSAVMLHMVSRIVPGIPVVFLDTGYLFPETYQFAEQLTLRLKLDLRVYQPQMTAARQEALYGKLWEGDQRSIELYHQINKVEPMDRALRDLAPRAWLAGLRRKQTSYRSGLRRIELQGDIYKVHPILGWDDEDIHRYLRTNDLPYHPLRKLGYRSIGDVHSTFATDEGDDPRAGRRLGVHSECGIHLPRYDGSMRSSGL